MEPPASIGEAGGGGEADTTPPPQPNNNNTTRCRQRLWRRAISSMFPYSSCIAGGGGGTGPKHRDTDKPLAQAQSGGAAGGGGGAKRLWKVTKAAPHHQVRVARDTTTGIQTLVVSAKDAAGPSISTSPSKYPGGLVSESTVSSLAERKRSLRKLAKSEEDLINATTIERRRITSPFLTLFRKKSTRPVLQPWAHLMAILDDSYDGVAKCLLNTVDRWAFNTFTLDTATCGHSLPYLMVHLLGKYDLLREFRIEPIKLFRLLSLVEAGYHVSNPYHNSVHAADVTQAMHCFLSEKRIMQHLTPIEILSALLAAVTHDLDHPGVNQQFLIETKNHLAALYNKTSVLENHHWRCAVACLQESECLSQLDKDSWQKVVAAIKSLILATDITRQQEFILRFQRYMESDSLDMTDYNMRHFILQIALKCADLCNPCRPWDISLQWSVQVCKEFYRQGDYERRLKIPVTPICDRYKTIIPKIQTDFFKFVAYPLFILWHEFLNTDLSHELLLHLKLNYSQWEKRIARATQQGSLETDINAPLASSEEDLSVLGEGEGLDDDSLCSLNKTSIDVSLLEATSFAAGTWGRRHSMPLQLSKHLPKPLIRRRRQSLPNRNPSHRWSLAASPQPARRGSDSAIGQTSHLQTEQPADDPHATRAASYKQHHADPTRRRSESFLDDEDELNNVLRRSEETPNLFLDVPPGSAERGGSYSSDASSCCSDGVHCGTPPLNDNDSSDRLCPDGLQCDDDLAPTAWSHGLSEVVEEPSSPPPQRLLSNRRSSAPIVLALVSSSSSSGSSAASSRRQSGDTRRGSLPVDVQLLSGCALLNKQVTIPELPSLASTPGARRGSCPVSLYAKLAD